MSRIRGLRALITGASSGIGAACARRFASEGANLVLWARRADRLAAVAKELSSHNVEIRTSIVDVRDRDAVERAASELEDAGLGPDILLNNAGLASGMAKLHEGDPDDWDRMIDTNVKGLLLVSRAIIPGMVKRNRGHVINLGSTAGQQVYPMGNVYNASKFAVRAINEGMNVDLAGTAVRVSSIDPGLVETEFSVVRFHGDEARAGKVYQGLRPLTADDVAEVISYVANLPEHMNILDLRLLPNAQRNQYVVHREIDSGKLG